MRKKYKRKCYFAKKASISFICLTCIVKHSFLKVSSWALRWPLSISHSSLRCLCINSVQDSVWSATNLRISGSFPKSPLKAKKKYDKQGLTYYFLAMYKLFLIGQLFHGFTLVADHTVSFFVLLFLQTFIFLDVFLGCFPITFVFFQVIHSHWRKWKLFWKSKKETLCFSFVF